MQALLMRFFIEAAEIGLSSFAVNRLSTLSFCAPSQNDKTVSLPKSVDIEIDIVKRHALNQILEQLFSGVGDHHAVYKQPLAVLCRNAA